MNGTIVLIGPIGAGKTTVGRLLAQRLGLPLCSVDDVRPGYYEQVGYDESVAAEIGASEQGFQGVLGYSKPFEARMIELVLAEHQDSVIDFGASNSVYEDEALLTRVENALAPYPNVILLLPSQDTAESSELLKNRLIKMLTEAGKGYSAELFDLNRYFIEHPSNHHLAKRVVYTKEKTPESICDEIMQGLETE